MRFAWIKKHDQVFEVTTMCQTLKVSRSGYHAWTKRAPSARAIRQQKMTQVIRDCFEESDQTYGSPRIWRELEEQQIDVCLRTVAKLMKKAGIYAIPRRGFVPSTTDSNHDHPIAGNVLDRDFAALAPNQKWCCDITYIETGEGYLYLSLVMDLYSRKIVGWSMDETLEAAGCLNALRMAINSRKPGDGLLHHSDRGVQYSSYEYARLLADHGIQVSMSRRGNCWDNAAMESCIATIKKEKVYRENYSTRQEARQSIFKYIECWYNRRRRHSSIGYMSPEEFEASRN